MRATRCICNITLAVHKWYQTAVVEFFPPHGSDILTTSHSTPHRIILQAIRALLFFPFTPSATRLLVSMMWTALFAAALAPLAVLAQDIVYDSIHNATSIQGTWSSGSQHVLTGPVSDLFF